MFRWCTFCWEALWEIQGITAEDSKSPKLMISGWLKRTYFLKADITFPLEALTCSCSAGMFCVVYGCMYMYVSMCECAWKAPGAVTSWHPLTHWSIMLWCVYLPHSWPCAGQSSCQLIVMKSGGSTEGGGEHVCWRVCRALTVIYWWVCWTWARHPGRSVCFVSAG